MDPPGVSPEGVEPQLKMPGALLVAGPPGDVAAEIPLHVGGERARR